jgi:hypothetical protein
MFISAIMNRVRIALVAVARDISTLDVEPNNAHDATRLMLAPNCSRTVPPGMMSLPASPSVPAHCVAGVSVTMKLRPPSASLVALLLSPHGTTVIA